MELFELERRIANPLKFSQDIEKMIKAENLKFDIKKTIAGIDLFHQLDVAVGTNNLTYFSGPFVATETNITNSFQRPEAEHVFISAIRIWEGTTIAPGIEATPWVPVTDEILQNATFTISVNGVVMLKNYPVRAALNTQTGKYDALIPLKELITWMGQTELKLDVSFKSPTTAIASGLRFELIGVGLVS